MSLFKLNTLGQNGSVHLMWSFEHTKAADMFLTTPTPSIISSDEFVFGEKIPNSTVENLSFALFFQPSWLNGPALQTAWLSVQNIDYSWFMETGLSLGALNALPCMEPFCFAVLQQLFPLPVATPPHCIFNSWVLVNTNRMRRFNGSRVEQFP